MSEQDVREWLALAMVGAGLLLYVLLFRWTPTQVVIGPLQIGASSGDCHGIDSADRTVYVEVCR